MLDLNRDAFACSAGNAEAPPGAPVDPVPVVLVEPDAGGAAVSRGHDVPRAVAAVVILILRAAHRNPSSSRTALELTAVHHDDSADGGARRGGSVGGGRDWPGRCRVSDGRAGSAGGYERESGRTEQPNGQRCEGTLRQ